MNQLIVTAFSSIWLLFYATAFGQNEYTINAKTGTLVIHEIKSVTLMGTDKGKLTIHMEGEKAKLPEKAKGLKILNPEGLEDNTGLGLSVVKEGDKYTVQKVSKKAGNRYVFHIPEGYMVHFESSSWNAGKLIIKDVKAELDVSANYNKVELSGVTGPMAIHSVYGSINADFSSVSQDGPISLYSVYQDVDVSIPSSAKVSFGLNVSYGDVYSDLDVTYPTPKDGMRNLSSKKLEAILNGGGVNFTIKSGYNNIYLRKK